MSIDLSTSGNEQKRKEFMADFILLCAKHGINLKSPYTLTNLCSDVILEHGNSTKFFYGGEPDFASLDPVAEAKKVLGIK